MYIPRTTNKLKKYDEVQRATTVVNPAY